MPVTRNAALGFVFVTLLIDCTGLGLIIPVTPKLIQELTGGDLSVASKYGGWLTFSYAIMQFVFAPVIGGLSDRYGRRPVLLGSLLGLGIDYVFLALAPTMMWLFVGRVIAGIFGASFTTATAYIADVSTPEKRAQNFGIVGAAFGLGFIIGPAIGGLFGSLGTRLPFIIAAGFSLVNFLYGYFILPESLLKENRRAFNWKRANLVGSLLHVKKYPSIAGLLGCFTLLYIASHALQSTWPYYTMEKFKWSVSAVGLSLALFGVMVVIVQGLLIRLAIPKLGKKNAVFLGLSLYIIGFTGFAFATESWMIFLVIVPYCLGGIAPPSIQGIMSTQVPANEQGELQGVVGNVISMTSIIGPLLMTNLFSYFTKAGRPVYFPGAPYLMGAVLTAVGIAFAIHALNKYHSNEKSVIIETAASMAEPVKEN